MPDVLLVYATTHGHTEKIAEHIAAALGEDGVRADVRDADSAADVSPADYDGVIVGGSIHEGHHQRVVLEWAKHHATTLSAMPSALFSVCLTAADDTDEARRATREYLDDFEDDTGWTPRTRTSIAGALQYREYDFVTRLVMRLLMGQGDHPTDTSRDYDYTDWDAVDRFARKFARTLGG